jgi:cytochrome c-type biogenesis protein CcmE
MSTKMKRTLASTAVIGGALVLLLYTTISEGAAYYKHVDEVMSAPAEWEGKLLKLHGFVEGDIAVKPATLEYQFVIRNGAHSVTTRYRGVVPDTFKTDSEVVVTGRLTPAGFEATEVTAKCPSKYEAGKK